jgi:hypothetical protein
MLCKATSNITIPTRAIAPQENGGNPPFLPCSPEAPAPGPVGPLAPPIERPAIGRQAETPKVSPALPRITVLGSIWRATPSFPPARIFPAQARSAPIRRQKQAGCTRNRGATEMLPTSI